MIIAFAGSREIGNIAWHAPNDIAAPPSGRNPPSPLPPSLKLVAFRAAGN